MGDRASSKNEPTKTNEKKINVNINKNFDCWKMDFMLLLIEYYKKYTKTHELNATDDILKWTNKYKEETDVYLSFLNENTEESITHIKTIDIYAYFKDWFRINNPNTKIPNNRDFISNIKKYKKIDKIRFGTNLFYGIKNLKIK